MGGPDAARGDDEVVAGDHPAACLDAEGGSAASRGHEQGGRTFGPRRRRRLRRAFCRVSASEGSLWERAQVYAMLETESGKVVRVAVECLAIQYLISAVRQRCPRQSRWSYPMMRAAAVRMAGLFLMQRANVRRGSMSRSVL